MILRNKYVRIVIAVLFIFAGFYTIIQAHNLKQKKSESSNWLSTDGKIIKSEIKTSTVSRRSGGMTTQKNVYSPEILYSYTINEKIYQSDKIGIDVDLQSELRTEIEKNYQQKYYPGRIVNVYYNPNDFSEAVLEVGDAGYVYSYYIIATVLFLFSALLIINFFTGFGEDIIDFFDR